MEDGRRWTDRGLSVTKRTVQDVDWAGKRALVRVDFNVPFQRGTERIADDARIRRFGIEV